MHPYMAELLETCPANLGVVSGTLSLPGHIYLYMAYFLELTLGPVYIGRGCETPVVPHPHVPIYSLLAGPT